jgi:hypothetical protein
LQTEPKYVVVVKKKKMLLVRRYHKKLDLITAQRTQDKKVYIKKKEELLEIMFSMRPAHGAYGLEASRQLTAVELVPKFHVALHASHAALQILTFQNFSP